MRFEYDTHQRQLLEDFVNGGGRFHHIYSYDLLGMPYSVTTVAYRRRMDTNDVEYAAVTWHADNEKDSFSRQLNIAHALQRFYGTYNALTDTYTGGSTVVVPDTTFRLRDRAKDYMTNLACDVMSGPNAYAGRLDFDRNSLSDIELAAFHQELDEAILTIGKLNRRFNFLNDTPANWQDGWWKNTLGRYGHTGAIRKKIQEREAIEEHSREAMRALFGDHPSGEVLG